MSAVMGRRIRLAFLLAGTAALVLSAGQPVHAIVINDQTAAAAGGIQNYFDSTNQFSNAVSLFDPTPNANSPNGSPARFALARSSIRARF
jgi:hypothetical protein